MEPQAARLSEDDYIARERQSDAKHELVHGVAVAMAGGSPRHNAIAANLIRELGTQLRQQPCVVLTSDQRVCVEPTGLYTYPDVSVVCGEMRFHPKHVDTLVNPTAIFEVLSRSTEAYDRGAKFAHFRRLPSLREYILVSQSHRSVEHHRRLDGGQWVLTEYEGDQASVQLPALGVSIALAELYLKVDGLEGDPATGPL